jgi:hypothetical protein
VSVILVDSPKITTLGINHRCTVISIKIENINARVHQDFIGLECHYSFLREVFREKINFSSFFGRKKPFQDAYNRREEGLKTKKKWRRESKKSLPSGELPPEEGRRR